MIVLRPARVWEGLRIALCAPICPQPGCSQTLANGILGRRAQTDCAETRAVSLSLSLSLSLCLSLSLSVSVSVSVCARVRVCPSCSTQGSDSGLRPRSYVQYCWRAILKRALDSHRRLYDATVRLVTSEQRRGRGRDREGDR